MTELVYLMSVLQIWKSFLSLKCQDAEVNDEWQRLISSLLSERAMKVFVSSLAVSSM